MTEGDIGDAARGLSASGQQTPNMPPTAVRSRYIHSDIFDRLVKNEDDLRGLVAYGLYQAEKRHWINDFESVEKSSPTVEEIKAFCFTYNDDRLQKLLAESEELIYRISDEISESQMESRISEAFNGRAVQEIGKFTTEMSAGFGRVEAAVARISGYRHHVIGHVIGFVVLVGLAALGLLIMNFEPTVGAIIHWLQRIL